MVYVSTAVQFLSVCATHSSTFNSRPQDSTRAVLHHLLKEEMLLLADTGYRGGNEDVILNMQSCLEIDS